MTHSFVLPLIVLVGVILFSSIMGPMISSVERFQDASIEPHLCVECKKETGTCTCFALDPKTNEIKEDSQKTMSFGSANDIPKELQGKHPMPYEDLVDRIKKAEKTEETQNKHIEDIRKVLSNTITTLRDDDVLPSGSHCSCASAPVVDPLTGEVDLTEGCRPPGWLRMMNARNDRDEECKE